MYHLRYLPAALRDIREIEAFFRITRNNPAFAERLVSEFEEAGNSIPAFPYANPAYLPLLSKRHQYRTLLIRNYLMIYWVDESHKCVNVVRVVNARTDYDSKLL